MILQTNVILSGWFVLPYGAFVYPVFAFVHPFVSIVNTVNLCIWIKKTLGKIKRKVSFYLVLPGFSCLHIRFYNGMIYLFLFFWLLSSFKHCVRWYKQTRKFYRSVYFLSGWLPMPLLMFPSVKLLLLLLLQPMLQELGKQNPHLLRLIQEHHAEFLQLINEPLEGSEGWVLYKHIG